MQSTQRTLIAISAVSLLVLAGCTSPASESNDTAAETATQPVTATAEIDSTNTDSDEADISDLNDLTSGQEDSLERILENDDEANITDAEIEDGVITAETEDGSVVSIGEGALIPENWPTDVALPDSMTPTVTTDDGEILGIVFSSTEAPDVLFSFYNGELDQAGWEISEQLDTAGFASLKASKDGRVLDILLLSDTENPGGSRATVSVKQ